MALAALCAMWHTLRMTVKNARAQRAKKTLTALKNRYPEASIQLEFASPWELLVATILSAQCTDARVNKITPEFFRRWPGPAELAQANLEDIENVIHSAGFFRNKAANLLASAKMAHDLHQDSLPSNIEELIKFPGVARKTANVVLFAGFGINMGIAVDTHVKRISYRLQLTENTDPVRVEKDLMSLFPRNEWGNINLRMVWFGRDICHARKPLCSQCELEPFCPKVEPPRK